MKIITLVHCSTADGNLKINVGSVTVSIITMSLAKSCKSGFIPGVSLMKLTGMLFKNLKFTPSRQPILAWLELYGSLIPFAEIIYLCN